MEQKVLILGSRGQLGRTLRILKSMPVNSGIFCIFV